MRSLRLLALVLSGVVIAGTVLRAAGERDKLVALDDEITRKLGSGKWGPQSAALIKTYWSEYKSAWEKT